MISISLSSVIYIPKFSLNLLSFTKLTKLLNWSKLFTVDFVSIQDSWISRVLYTGQRARVLRITVMCQIFLDFIDSYYWNDTYLVGGIDLNITYYIKNVNDIKFKDLNLIFYLHNYPHIDTFHAKDEIYFSTSTLPKHLLHGFQGMFLLK